MDPQHRCFLQAGSGRNQPVLDHSRRISHPDLHPCKLESKQESKAFLHALAAPRNLRDWSVSQTRSADVHGVLGCDARPDVFLDWLLGIRAARVCSDQVLRVHLAWWPDHACGDPYDLLPSKVATWLRHIRS